LNRTLGLCGDSNHSAQRLAGTRRVTDIFTAPKFCDPDSAPGSNQKKRVVPPLGLFTNLFEFGARLGTNMTVSSVARRRDAIFDLELFDCNAGERPEIVCLGAGRAVAD